MTLGYFLLSSQIFSLLSLLAYSWWFFSLEDVSMIPSKVSPLTCAYIPFHPLLTSQEIGSSPLPSTWVCYYFFFILTKKGFSILLLPIIAPFSLLLIIAEFLKRVSFTHCSQFILLFQFSLQLALLEFQHSVASSEMAC